MPVVALLLSAALMFFLALATAVQRTIHSLDLFHSREQRMPAETRTQTLILLGVYLRRLNVAFLFGMALYLAISRASTWQYGVLIVALSWIGSLLMASMPWLRPASARMMALLVADLERRRIWYQMIHSTTRLHAVEDLLARVRSTPRAGPASGLHR